MMWLTGDISDMTSKTPSQLLTMPEAGLRQAIGVAADADINDQGSQLNRLPANLADDVEKMMADALKSRPDIAAQIATVRADDASMAGAQGRIFPRG